MDQSCHTCPFKRCAARPLNPKSHALRAQPHVLALALARVTVLASVITWSDPDSSARAGRRCGRPRLRPRTLPHAEAIPGAGAGGRKQVGLVQGAAR